MRESFIFYRSFWEAIELFDSKKDRLTMYEAIMRYGLYGEEIKLKGVKKAMFILIKPQLDANNRRYENGCKGGAPKENQNARKNNQKQPNENENENENVNENDEALKNTLRIDY